MEDVREVALKLALEFHRDHTLSMSTPEEVTKTAGRFEEFLTNGVPDRFDEALKAGG
jgi:hypothetical protein